MKTSIANMGIAVLSLVVLPCFAQALSGHESEHLQLRSAATAFTQSFFVKDDGKNCTHVDQDDPSWGYICDEHPMFPDGYAKYATDAGLDDADLDRRDGPKAIDYVNAAIGGVGGASGIVGNVLTGLVNRSVLKGVLQGADAKGAYATKCIANVPAATSYKTSAGEERYFYSCFSKSASTTAKCSGFISDAEIDTGLNHVYDYFEGTQAYGGCVQYETTSGVLIRVKYAATKNQNVNASPCDLECGQYHQVQG